MVAVGDNLIHNVIYQSSYTGDTYQFDPIYAPVKAYIRPADIAFINQETLLGGKQFGYSSYPLFNTPQEMGSTLSDLGFDIINHANNHVMDKRSKAVIATMDYWESVPDIAYIGIHRSQEAHEKPLIIERYTIKVGFLAYTYGTNGIPVPEDMPYLVSLIDVDTMAQEIDALRPLCDILVVSMHWGNEYQLQPSAVQVQTSTFLAEHQVDVVIGHHPHVLQKCAVIPRPDGKDMLVFYSLGNFMSAQKQPRTLVGGIAYIKIKKVGTDISFDEYGIIPVVTHYEQHFTGFRVYALSDYTDELFNTHWIKRAGLVTNTSVFNTMVQDMFGTALITHNPFIQLDKQAAAAPF
jgi:poly-gamma-glutamate synthesis protein (capsule biosynthesis protein)